MSLQMINNLRADQARTIDSIFGRDICTLILLFTIFPILFLLKIKSMIIFI